MLEANNFMLILEVFYALDIENTEEYAVFLLFKRKKIFNDTQSVIRKLQVFSVAGLIKDKGLY